MILPEWLFYQLDDTLVWIGAMTICLIALVWGIASVQAAYDHCSDREKPRWHHRRWLPQCFEFWLGVFLILFVSVFSLIIGVEVLRSPEEIDLWAFAWMIVCSGVAIMAFRCWARDRVPGKAP